MLPSRLLTTADVQLVSATDLAFNLRLIVDNTTDYTGVEEAFLKEKIVAAIAYIEQDTGRFYQRQTRQAHTRHFCQEMLLSANLQEVISVKYIDFEGVEQTVPDDQYTVLYSRRNTVDGIELLSNFVYPSLSRRNDAIRIEYTAGFDDESALPVTIRQAVLMLASHWYENRESANITGSGFEIKETPMAYESLVRTQRVEAPIG